MDTDKLNIELARTLIELAERYGVELVKETWELIENRARLVASVYDGFADRVDIAELDRAVSSAIEEEANMHGKCSVSFRKAAAQ